MKQSLIAVHCRRGLRKVRPHTLMVVLTPQVAAIAQAHQGENVRGLCSARA